MLQIKKPHSHNKNGSSDSYKKGLQDEFQSKYAHLYQDIPIKDTTLQARIICIHQFQKGCVPDVDNISKPKWTFPRYKMKSKKLALEV